MPQIDRRGVGRPCRRDPALARCAGRPRASPGRRGDQPRVGPKRPSIRRLATLPYALRSERRSGSRRCEPGACASRSGTVSAMKLVQSRRLVVGGSAWDVECVITVRLGPATAGYPPKPISDVQVLLETSALGPTFALALERARRLTEATSTDARSRRWSSSTPTSTTIATPGRSATGAHLRAVLPAPQPPPFDPDDHELATALRLASHRLQAPIRIDDVTTTARYYLLPISHIGTLGGFIDRRDSSMHEAGPGLPWAQSLWGYERGLLHDPPWDLVIERVDDDRATAAVTRFADVDAGELRDLPRVLPRAATWRAIGPLHDAGDALTWAVRAPQA
ncbi:MAG: hypothetical protein IPL61_39140 [Myxococcales bacterium]|nr:hypothetical protein [Myxococcales bacterium]